MTAQSWHSQSNNCSPSSRLRPLVIIPKRSNAISRNRRCSHEHSDCGHSGQTLGLNVSLDIGLDFGGHDCHGCG